MTLKDDIQALQNRLKQELGLDFRIELRASDVKQKITKETALSVGLMLSGSLGVPMERGDSEHYAWVKLNDYANGVECTVFCDELIKVKSEEVA